MEPIHPQPGSARDPRHFVGRVRTTAVATRKLKAGTNLLLNDPRRMGKTYWLTYFTDITQDFTPVFVDYEGVRSNDEFLLRTAEALRGAQSLAEDTRQALRAFFDNFDTTIGGGPLKVKVALQQQSPTKLLTDALAAVASHATKPVLICMDEVPLALHNIASGQDAASARELLQTLRALRQGHPQVRWILAGSVGFHHVLRFCGTTEGDINDLDNLPLGPLAEAEAIELAERLFLGIGRDPLLGAQARLVRRTGGIPFLLHKVASLLDDESGRDVLPQEVDEAFEDLIDDPDEVKAIAHLLTRLEPHYGDDTLLAREILDGALSRANDWLPMDGVNRAVGSQPAFSSVLDNLVNDHYLEVRGLAFRWRYPTLQYLWARRRRIWDRP